jgi:hypothetical protein
LLWIITRESTTKQQQLDDLFLLSDMSAAEEDQEGERTAAVNARSAMSAQLCVA